MPHTIAPLQDLTIPFDEDAADICADARWILFQCKQICWSLIMIFKVGILSCNAILMSSYNPVGVGRC